MRCRAVGSLEVSVLGLGCNNFGGRLGARETDAVVSAAIECGVTLFDTSDNYGGMRSEEYLGRALRGRRDSAVIATKFGMPLPAVPGSGGSSPRWIREAVEASLRRLGSDHIDLYQAHFPDPGVPVEDTLGALSDLVGAGKVREIGCSNFTAAQLGGAARAASACGLPPFASVQAEYSLLHRAPESDGLAESCRQHGVRLLPYFPLAGGLLTGKQRPGHLVGRLTLERYQRFVSERNFGLVDRLTAFGAEHGRSLLELAIGWLLARPAVGAVLAGASSAAQMRANAAAVTTLNAGEIAGLDLLSGGGAVPVG